MDDVCEGKDFSFPKQEEKIIQWWEEIKAFETQLERTKHLPEYVFYDGPPFATGLPHYGHILAGTIKDVVTRYQTMRGHHVTRRFGWDCHGLPVEFEIDTKLGIKTRDDVLKMGIGNYNDECRSIVTRYVGEWEKVVARTGRWIDFKNDYKTMDLKFMETVWWVFSQLFDKGLVYRGFKVMPYSTGCKTPLSNFEANSNYKEVSDPEIMAAFPIVDDPEGTAFVAWTTTPWTLPSNLALCVNANFVYVKVRNKFNGKTYIVAESRLSELPVEKPRKAMPNGTANDSERSNSTTKGSSGGKSKSMVDTYEVLDKFSGAALVGTKYVPLFEYFVDFSDVAFRVLADNYVTSDSGTGVVHMAPAFGEDDYRVCIENQVINKGESLIVAVDDDGCFTGRITDFSGRYIKDADKDIIQAVKDKGRLVKSGSCTHSYPFCWRSDTPLIYRAVPSWFVAVEKLKDQLLENNKQTYWVPDFVKEKRFHNWLENARDWAVSRSRFWGTPLPVWTSDDGEETIVMDSIDKLEKLSGVKVADLHRHKIDHISIPSSRGPSFGVLRRVEDVFDCWFESGSMPYAYIHYPFENVELFEKNFPGHFVAEGLDQTRGWFYTLMVLSTALFGKPAFRNLICNGLVLAEDGRKMSKRLKNYPSPMEVINDYGADALRLYIINSPVVRAEPLRFKKDGVFGVVKDVFLPWYNAYRFLVQNAKRLEVEGLAPFIPVDKVTLQQSSNVLDQWINSATRSLVHFVQQEMDGYRLYTVVPYLLKFLDDLTNVYVRFNRKRLKGRTGEDDCRVALSTLYHVLLTSCKAMAPFTPFFTEVLYQNLRKASNGLEESIHFCSFPQEEGKGGQRIEQSVKRMKIIIDLARNIRERHNKPLKTPLKEMVVVHPDAEFLDDIAGKLKEFVLEELNVKSVVPCNDLLKYASLRAEPDFSVLGKRLGKSMGIVAKEVKAMSQKDILDFEKHGEVTIATHCLKLSDIKINRGFRRPDNMTEEEIDAAGDGDVLVILDLRPDESLFEAGVAREVVNRIQKLRKKAALEPTDMVEVYFKSLDEDESTSQQILNSQEQYIRDVLGSYLLPSTMMPPHAVILAQESFHGISNLAFSITLARPALLFNSNAVLALYGEDTKFANGLQTYLLSRDHHNLKSEFHLGNGKVTVDCIENQPAVEVALGVHVFLTVGDYLLSTKAH
ncbi:isoleucine--tRNA ligase, cytoplasmic isoform X2 [Rhododendron vialii]|uniref:isoleucine--tRNA ligase, cytoplasmic isoform X1 n=1 Tax=Rhododendron vialii TaxID=182163 RepID=UPI0026603B0F|nr:isoleucine--tRNA ligase, cytoplasmic isoform X1 [Rhododendron vialii]XP_058214011.1 isoleucine--tRNA ligase, cytoplasmic isoform X2 [Rhododendron vialii]